MKAIDILIYILECGGMIHVDRGFMSNVSKAVEELKEHLSDKDDQIKWLREELKYHEAELEALQSRSCATCKYDGTFRYMGKDSRCTRCCNFFSNRYVPKDNQRNQHLMIRESK